MVRRRRRLVGLILVLSAACASEPAFDEAAPVPTTSTFPTTTVAPTTTTAPLPADMADLATSTTMTERARRIFLAARPAIEDGATFAGNCGVDNPADGAGTRTHTAGCYVAGRIHLLAPDRVEARDLLYVVAAHELLHAVYSSLGPAERARIDAELEAARAGNDRLEERLKPYAGLPTLTNEIHSILGSEFDGLSPALEAHYAAYFSDRGAVVAARQRTLGTREIEIARLRTEVDDLDSRIETLRATLISQRAASDIRAYNANVEVFNVLIDRYNTTIDTLNAKIEEYNGLLGG
ncbi:MAG TPA: hypothetical protein VMZ73_01730 [Acidimicrobiales bacterium]|nr:hypothetical protein [Acidimicrobiales bacterium]